MHSINTLQELFIHNLQDIYHAEKQLLKALPTIAEAASSDALREAIENHLDETCDHVERLDEIST